MASKPYFEKLSPDTEKISVYEGESQPFSFNAKDDAGDPISYEFVIRGKVVKEGIGNNGTYLFKAGLIPSDGYDYSGSPYVLYINITDGNSGMSHFWNITVINKNRPPVPVLDAPKEGATYRIGTSIAFSAKSSKDPDPDDKLTCKWAFGDGESIVLSEVYHTYSTPGKYQVDLEVSDGTETFSRSVNITIIAPNVKIMPLEVTTIKPKEGKPVVFKASLKNTGDAPVSTLKVLFYIDSKTDDAKIGEAIIPSINVSETVFLNQSWTAIDGPHTVYFVVLKDKTFLMDGPAETTSAFTVARKPEPPVPITNFLYGVVITIVIILTIILRFLIKAWKFMKFKGS